MKATTKLGVVYESYRNGQWRACDYVDAVVDLFGQVGLRMDEETEASIDKLNKATFDIWCAYDGDIDDEIIDAIWRPLAETINDKIEFLLEL